MTLPTRPLGSSGLGFTTVGFGAWAIGGGGWAFGWGPQDDADSLAAMRRALELGVNWIDTAAVYGLGHSEELVGRLLRELPARARPLVFTKCGLVWDERNRMAEAQRVLRPDSIRKECEASLRRLGVQQIDLYQFHWPDETGTPVEDSWQTMLRVVEEGKVRAARVAALAPDDWRRRSPQFQQPALGKNLALRDALKPIARRHGTTVSAVAVAWTLAWPGVSGAIVGARTAAQVDGWIGAATLELTAADLDEIAAAITRTGAGTGPTRPVASGVTGR